MGLLGKIFYTTGKASARRPWTSIFIGLVIVAIGSLGFINWQSTVSFRPFFLKIKGSAVRGFRLPQIVVYLELR